MKKPSPRSNTRKLIWAADSANLVELKEILSSSVPFDIDGRDGLKLTALMHAAGGSGPVYEAIVSALIEAGADVTLDRGRATIHRAGSPEIVRLLLAAGADVNRTTSYGETPLSVAMHERRPRVARALIQAGAKLDLRSGNHPDPARKFKTPLEIGRASHSARVRALAADPHGTADGAYEPKGTPVAELIARLDRWMKTNRPAYYATFKPGLTDEAWAAFVQQLGVEPPVAMRALYQWRDGAGYENFYRNWILMDSESVLGTQKMLNDFLDTNEWDTPDANWWNHHWIPIMENGGGDNICIDVKGAFGGVSGQVLGYGHDYNWRNIEAPSLDIWLECFVASLEAGEWSTDPDGYWGEKLEEDRYVRGYPKKFSSADQ